MCSPSSLAFPETYFLPAGSGLPQGAAPSELPRTARLRVSVKQDSRHRRLESSNTHSGTASRQLK
eukprot:9797485-Alexandrium_andersonii.AAC.1